jgi:hypothetical protein
MTEKSELEKNAFKVRTDIHCESMYEKDNILVLPVSKIKKWLEEHRNCEDYHGINQLHGGKEMVTCLELMMRELCLLESPKGISPTAQKKEAGK